jgi:hypothetical protein
VHSSVECLAFLGKFGSAADLERIANLYDETAIPQNQLR